MFKPVRKKINEIDHSAAEALLQSNRRGIIAMNGDEGYPYAIPVSYTHLDVYKRQMLLILIRIEYAKNEYIFYKLNFTLLNYIDYNIYTIVIF